MLINFIVAAAYFYFNWRYFSLCARALRLPKAPKLPVVGAFVVNYLLFYFCSVQELNLLVNWALFFLFLLCETLLYCKKDWRASVFFALNGILHGLTVNIFCRCAVSIMVNRPLAAFDNNISEVGNLKALPVFLGFLLGGAVLHSMALPKFVEKQETLIRHPRHLSFQLELMGGMFLYLFLNLLLYQSHSDSLLLKVWGIKSCVFSLTGAYLGMRYSLKMCRLSDYREQNRLLSRELEQRAREEAELRSIAYRDALTGAYNRQFAMDQLGALLQRQERFALCFLDLDNLKSVNDLHGHKEGDRYLTAVAEQLAGACRGGRDLLARYGGDEFLLLLLDTVVPTAEERIRRVNLQLREMSRNAPFPMSVSYGVVDERAAADAAGLISAADEKMYRHKLEKS